MKLKNYIILSIQRTDKPITANTLDAVSAYKVIKFRRAIQEASKRIVDAEKELLSQCNLTIKDKGAIDGKPEDIERFVALRMELYQDESEVGDVNTIPYTEWHKLKNENSTLATPIVEDTLENILWEAPEE